MKLQYLGTAAAEGFPGMFCTCDTCNRARKAGGKNIRTRSQAIVDDFILIDFPADTYYHTITHGLNLQNIHHCIITHSHCDHFYPADFEMRRVGFASTDSNEPLNIYAAESAFNKTSDTLKEFNLEEEGRVKAHLIKPYKPFNIENYIITALPADHDPNTSPVVYLIQKENTALLYAHDTGIFTQDVWNWLENSQIKLSFVSIDCTAGLLKGWQRSHLGLDTCTTFADKLRSIKCADNNTKWCINHFSHNCLADYDEILPIASQHNFDVSYDGKTVIF